MRTKVCRAVCGFDVRAALLACAQVQVGYLIPHGRACDHLPNALWDSKGVPLKAGIAENAAEGETAQSAALAGVRP
jgi:hypothetical protein